MRFVPLALSVSFLLSCGSALAQGPLNQQPGGTQQPVGPQPAPVGAVPQLSDQEPARAPGSAGDQGKTLPPTNENSGTTTVYAPAKPTEEVRWPCAQPRVSSISAGTMWSGPDPAQGKDWDQDNDVAELAQTLASRRTSLDQVDSLVADFANKAGASKDKQLTKLFVGVLDIINENRSSILDGIMRYAQGQERLAERMREESDKISESQSDATAEGVGLAATQQNRDFAWDQRIFKERRQALTYVCETPTLLEQRAYEISKRIQARL
jgi:hypothetical protein